MNLKELYETSPLGMVSALIYGGVQSALFLLLAVYAASMNFTILEISIVTFLLAVSGAISQWPIGKLSDIFDRRKVIIYSTFGAAFCNLRNYCVKTNVFTRWFSNIKNLVLCMCYTFFFFKFTNVCNHSCIY